ncbi:hypothetical protein AOB54_07685 [beta proteobacterium MWH-UniP1]
MSKVIVKGFECDIMIMEITKAQYNQIKKDGRHSKAWASLEEDLMSQTLLYGFTFDVDALNFQVQVNGKDRTDLAIQILGKCPAPVVRHAVSNPKGYYLVRDTWTPEAFWGLDIKGRFSPEKLQFLTGEVAVPDGSFRCLVGVGYNGVELNREPPSQYTDDLYLVGPDHVRVPVSV